MIFFCFLQQERVSFLSKKRFFCVFNNSFEFLVHLTSNKTKNKIELLDSMELLAMLIPPLQRICIEYSHDELLCSTCAAFLLQDESLFQLSEKHFCQLSCVPSTLSKRINHYWQQQWMYIKPTTTSSFFPNLNTIQFVPSQPEAKNHFSWGSTYMVPSELYLTGISGTLSLQITCPQCFNSLQGKLQLSLMTPTSPKNVPLITTTFSLLMMPNNSSEPSTISHAFDQDCFLKGSLLELVVDIQVNPQYECVYVEDILCFASVELKGQS